ncbi:MAG TPA: hypothetical protein VJR89_38755 [Polyangiales bacterium]|nr:hypothetical protein [Polyangiales bacterium]
MLIFNDKPVNEPTAVEAKDNAEFFRMVAAELRDDNPAILLFGASDFASWTVRSQQAVLRYDRRPSDYSHAALICEWNLKAPEQSWGLQLDPVRVPASQQQPEFAGVTPFRLRDLADAAALPNVAVITVPLKSDERDRVLMAARTPLRDPMRFPLLRWLSTWRAFVSMPESMPHPLLNRVPHPGAAFVAMAYEAADITLIPGATDLQYCPELLWANAKYWSDAVRQDVRVFRKLRDESATAPKAKSAPIVAPE